MTEYNGDPVVLIGDSSLEVERMIGLQSGRPNWEGLKSFPSPGSMTGKVYGASAVSFGTSFMIFGGYSWPEIYSSIYEFFENKWSNKGEMLLPRHGHRSVLTKSGDSWTVYHVGGAHEGLDQNRPSFTAYEVFSSNGTQFISTSTLDRLVYWPETFTVAA